MFKPQLAKIKGAHLKEFKLVVIDKIIETY